MTTRTVILALLAAAVPAWAAAQQKPAVPPATAPAPSAAAAPTAPTDQAVERITQEELKKLMKKNKVLVVDVRGAEAYKGGHIPGSISAPLSEIDKHLEELKSAKKRIVTYCS
jgi:3-mercaptopyruvate sulfurtransferase SseA